MSNEQNVPINPAVAGGALVRVQENKELQTATGQLATVQTQFLVLADDQGNAVDLRGAFNEMITLLRSIDARLEKLQFTRGGL